MELLTLALALPWCQATIRVCFTACSSSAPSLYGTFDKVLCLQLDKFN